MNKPETPIITVQVKLAVAVMACFASLSACTWIPKTSERPSTAATTISAPISTADKLAHTDGLAQSTHWLGFTMVSIPAGSFVMGGCMETDPNKGRSSPNSPPSACLAYGKDINAYPEETPQHRMQIPAFQMSAYEVTLGQFKRYASETSRDDLLNGEFLKQNRYGDDAPVVHVSWMDAQAFVQWLNKVDGPGWALPTEAQWEYACRAGGKHALYCGPYVRDDLAWHHGNSAGQPHAVGEKMPNAWALFDMNGNVSEWVGDCWNPNLRTSTIDLQSQSANCPSNWRVLRGGSWYDHPDHSRATTRLGFITTEKLNYVGFRLAKNR
jgi:formylglycine-generating enzyme required for sulfatase activity